MRVAALIPLALTALRALLAPVMIGLALYRPDGFAFGVCLVLAFLSDLFDGIIARRLKVATPALRRLDSVADTLFYLGAVFAAWHLYPAALKEHAVALAVLIALELARYAFDLLKFKREASYHMWSSKLWGIFLFTGFFSLLALGNAGLPLALAIYVGIVADLEGLAISIVMRECKTDIPTIFHALHLRNTG
jgi:CDP-diacylglycerol--glycerol-3-phosphate 3-phosphatidyltransferase